MMFSFLASSPQVRLGRKRILTAKGVALGFRGCPASQSIQTPEATPARIADRGWHQHAKTGGGKRGKSRELDTKLIKFIVSK
jgi:hypothetical protein